LFNTIGGGFSEIKIASYLRLKKMFSIFGNSKVWARIRPENFTKLRPEQARARPVKFDFYNLILS